MILEQWRNKYNKFLGYQGRIIGNITVGNPVALAEWYQRPHSAQAQWLCKTLELRRIKYPTRIWIVRVKKLTKVQTSMRVILLRVILPTNSLVNWFIYCSYLRDCFIFTLVPLIDYDLWLWRFLCVFNSMSFTKREIYILYISIVYSQ